MKEDLSKVLRNTKVRGWLEIVVLLIIALGMAITISSGLNIMLNGATHPTAAVTTGSMIPIYNGYQDTEQADIYPLRGDILLVRKVLPASIEIGEVIVFNVSQVSDPIVHRVVDKWEVNETYYFKTNGDNRKDPDTWVVKGKDVFGIVVVRIPYIGWFLILFQSTPGRIILLVSAAFLLFSGNGEETNDKNAKTADVFPKGKRRKGTYIRAGLLLLPILIFIGFNLFAAFASPPSVMIYSIPTDSSSSYQNLLESTKDDKVTLFLPSSRYRWKKDGQSPQETFFFPIRINVVSGGILNNIDSIEIVTNVLGMESLYRWTLVYNYVGVRTLEGGIIALISGEGIFNASITLNYYSRGLFASNPSSTTFPLLLDNR
ncbi:MAG: signal peptidase I [Candidatus Heimdallarchaeota archaeon]